ncbi:hypothetical protein [Methylobacterium sp. J-076]|uniref:hypothetical protein n=1 Tax=Methylobacterium sp. J-076 TaxID=2836655 RepID=UPI001FB9B5C6|nr:hypothetical protein [Methylobacterium sp. J-076]MCJ2013630.1 hypothetical protein [Methylobacterium sp. J-076]
MMAYVTIEKDGEPWMICHAVHDDALERRIASAKAEVPTATFTHRLSTPVESQRCAEAMDAQAGLVEDPFDFFATKIDDLPR